MKKTVFFVFCISVLINCVPKIVLGNKIDSTSWFINFSYGLQIPGKDMKLRFGANSSFETFVSLRSKNNWEIGLGGEFIFGNIVKEKNHLNSLLTKDGLIIDLSGKPVDVFFYERGYTAYISIGKYTNLFGVNPYSGVYFRTKTGILEHWIKITTQNKDLPILEKNYLKGYDRLSNGFFVGQEIGYQFIGNQKLSKFNLGFFIHSGFTKNRRSRNFEIGKPINSPRLDLLYGLKLGWIIKIGNSDSEYSYH